MTLSTPMRAGLHAAPPATLAFMQGIPGIEYANETVTFSAPDFRAAYDGVIALVGAASTGYSRVLMETVSKHPDGKNILANYRDSLFMRWMDAESGRWHRPAPVARNSNKAYFGDR